MMHLPSSQLANSINKSLVCLICYKRFVKSVSTKPTLPVIKIKTEPEQSFVGDPLNILEEDDYQYQNQVGDHDDHRKEEESHEKQNDKPLFKGNEDIYRRFLRFAERYLKLGSSTDYFNYHANQLNGQGDSDVKNGKNENIEAFCANCRDTISNICDLHQDIEERQLYLLEKLDSLGNSMKRSAKKVSTKLEKSLGKVLAQQLNVKAVSRVLNFRKIVEFKCRKRKIRKAPMVVVHRGLFPDQWKFTFAATKRELARLIFIFSLAHWSPTTAAAAPESEITGIPLKSNASFLKITASNAENENVPKIRRRRKQVKKSDKLVSQVEETFVKKEISSEEIIKVENLEQLECKAVSEDNHPAYSPSPLNNLEDNSDPEWQSPPASPDYQVSSDKEDSSDSNSSDPDFHIGGASPKKRTRRVTRRTRTFSPTNADLDDDDTSIPPPSIKRRRRGRPRRSSPSRLSSPNKKLPYHCDKCPGKSFKFHKGLRVHLRRVHNIIADFPCDICGIMVKNSIELLDHKRVIHQNKERRERGSSYIKTGRGGSRSTTSGFECQKCGQFFTQIADFKEHWRLHSNLHGGVRRSRNYLNGGSKKRKKFQRSEWPTTTGKQLLRENKEKWTNCELCGYHDKGYHLRKHLEDNHEKEDDKKLLCYFCDKRFTIQQTLNLHVRAAHMGLSPKPVFFCHFEDKCGRPFLTWPELHDHMKKHLEGIGEEEIEEKNEEEGGEGDRPQKKIFYCDLCGWGTFFENYVDAHKMHHVEMENGVYHCTKCAARFERMASLTGHYNKVHGSNVQQFKCQLCGVRVASRIGLEVHYYEHKQVVEEADGGGDGQDEEEGEGGGGSKKNSKVCREEGCGKIFPSVKLLTEHLQKEHEKEGPEYKCEICEKRFYMACLLKYHMRMHREPEFECNICQKKFKRRLVMERHKTKKHAEEEDSEGHLKCSDPDCDKMFVSRNLMHRHLARVHQKGPLVHMCQQCGKIFLNNSDLTQHQRFHDAPQFECDICHKQLKRGITLRQHMDTFHNPDRVYDQFICPTCGKVYHSTQGLKFHIESAHTEESERRFACPNCPRRFHRPSLLHLHMKNCKNEKGEIICSSSVYQIKPKTKGLTKKMMEYRKKQKMLLKNTTSNDPQLAGQQDEPIPALPPPPQNILEQGTMTMTSGHDQNHQQAMCFTSSGNIDQIFQNEQNLFNT